ncbi:MAG: cation diffusion facilitator family transporter [Actinomycetaceae bacterium]|nr:cation diffusion facilitator family transporter [Actinomycetaceae bacterium]
MHELHELNDMSEPPSTQPVSPAHQNKPTSSVSSTSSIIAAIISNILVGIVKFIAAAFSGSSAMIAEGIHSIVDSGNGLLVFLGVRRSRKKADTHHPFGYGQELYFWTLVVAIMIFALGGGFSIYEGIQHFYHPRNELENTSLNYIIIGISGIIEGVSLAIAIKNFNKARGKLRPMQFIREAKDPSLFTVVLEDSAAELGLIFAFLGIFCADVFHNPHIDTLASIAIGLLLCAVSIVLLRESKGLLIGEGLKNDELKVIESIAESNPFVVECGRILSMYMGPHDLLLAMDVTFTFDASRDDIVRAVDEIEMRIAERFPDATRVFIESESLRFTRKQALHSAANEDAVE